MARNITRELPIEMSDVGMGNVSAQLIRSTSNRGYEHPWSLRIRDARSGEHIVEIRLDADNFSALMAGSNAFAYEAEVTAHPERLGRVREHHTELVPKELYLAAGVSNNSGSPSAEQIAMSWGVEQTAVGMPYEGWDPFHITAHCPQGGWRVTFNRWVAERP